MDHISWCLFLANFSSLVYCLLVMPRAYPRVEHLKGTLLDNIRIGWKNVQARSTLALGPFVSYEEKKVLYRRLLLCALLLAFAPALRATIALRHKHFYRQTVVRCRTYINKTIYCTGSIGLLQI